MVSLKWWFANGGFGCKVQGPAPRGGKSYRSAARGDAKRGTLGSRRRAGSDGVLLRLIVVFVVVRTS